MDLDGTLTNPFEGIAASVCHAMTSMGLEAPSADDLRLAIGPPLRHTLGKFLGSHDSLRIEQALGFYRECYSDTGLLQNHVYPGVPDMLTKLKAAGCRLFVATSKPSVYARRITDHFGLSRYFVKISGAELNGALENKRDLLRFILDSESLGGSATAMVGDRSHDMVAAKAHGLCAVGVTWGFGSRAELQDAGADLVCEAPSDIVRFFIES